MVMTGGWCRWYCFTHITHLYSTKNWPAHHVREFPQPIQPPLQDSPHLISNPVKSPIRCLHTLVDPSIKTHQSIERKTLDLNIILEIGSPMMFSALLDPSQQMV